MQGDTNQVTTTTTQEVLDTQGNTLNRGDAALSGIFDRIEVGKQEGKTTADVLKEQASKPAAAQKEDKGNTKPAETTQEKTDLDKKLDDTQNKKQPAEGRKGLLEQTEANPVEVKKEDKKEEEKPEEVPEEELKVLPHDKPKTAKRIQALLKRIETVTGEVTKTKKEAEEKATKLAELEKKLTEAKPATDPAVNDAVKKQLDELAMYRRRYALDQDPDVKSRYDGRVESSEKSINDILTNAGLGDQLMKVIKDQGGWMKFAESSLPLNLKDGKVAPAYEVAESILQLLPIAQRKAVEAAMVEQIQTRREKDRYFQEEQAKANDFFKKQEEEVKKSQQAQETQLKETAAKIETWHKKTIEENEWLREKEIPTNATKEQKAAIEEDNRYTRQLNQVLKNSFNPKSIDDAIDVIFDSVRFYQERREKAKLQSEVTQLKKDLEAKQEEINKFKNGAKTTTKPGSIATSPAGGGTKEKAPKSLEDAFSAIERGEKLDGSGETEE